MPPFELALLLALLAVFALPALPKAPPLAPPNGSESSSLAAPQPNSAINSAEDRHNLFTMEASGKSERHGDVSCAFRPGSAPRATQSRLLRIRFSVPSRGAVIGASAIQQRTS